MLIFETVRPHWASSSSSACPEKAGSRLEWATAKVMSRFCVSSAQPSSAAATSENDQREPTAFRRTPLATAWPMIAWIRPAVSRIPAIVDLPLTRLKTVRRSRTSTFTVPCRLLHLSGALRARSGSLAIASVPRRARRLGRPLVRVELAAGILNLGRRNETEGDDGHQRFEEALPEPHFVDQIGRDSRRRSASAPRPSRARCCPPASSRCPDPGWRRPRDDRRRR